MIKKIDDKGQTLCKIQGQMFVESLNRYNGSSYVFIKTFMESNVAFEIDENNVLNISEVFEEMDEYTKLNIGNEKINRDVMYWIGYIYRYWAYTYRMRSKRIFSIANSNLMEQLYAPYHTMDPSLAIERIMEDNNFDVVSDDALEVLKRIYNEE